MNLGSCLFLLVLTLHYLLVCLGDILYGLFQLIMASEMYLIFAVFDGLFVRFSNSNQCPIPNQSFVYLVLVCGRLLSFCFFPDQLLLMHALNLPVILISHWAWRQYRKPSRLLVSNA